MHAGPDEQSSIEDARLIYTSISVALNNLSQVSINLPSRLKADSKVHFATAAGVVDVILPEAFILRNCEWVSQSLEKI